MFNRITCFLLHKQFPPPIPFAEAYPIMGTLYPICTLISDPLYPIIIITHKQSAVSFVSNVLVFVPFEDIEEAFHEGNIDREERDERILITGMRKRFIHFHIQTFIFLVTRSRSFRIKPWFRVVSILNTRKQFKKSYVCLWRKKDGRAFLEQTG